jgi:hypothetical protein
MMPNKVSWKEKHVVQEEGKITDNMDADENSETAKDIPAGTMMLKGTNNICKTIEDFDEMEKLGQGF